MAFTINGHDSHFGHVTQLISISSHKLSYTCIKVVKYSQQLRSYELITIRDSRTERQMSEKNNDFPFSEEERGGCLAG